MGKSTLLKLLVALAAMLGVTSGLKAPHNVAAIVSSSQSSALLKIRGGGSIEHAVADTTSQNLVSFYAINGLSLGILFSFSLSWAMNAFHKYELGSPPGNKATYKAGASMLAYGALSFATVIYKMEPSKAMGYSLIPIIANLALRDLVQDQKEHSLRYKTEVSILVAALTYCAYHLVSKGMGMFAASLPAKGLGLLCILSILFPTKMMSVLEYNPQDSADLSPKDMHQMKFLTQAIGTHKLIYLVQFWALYKGYDAFQAIGLATMALTVMNLVVCVAGPHLRKSGAPVAPLLPFLVLYVFMSFKLGAVKIVSDLLH